jgi:SAM-dependent methyltransferase
VTDASEPTARFTERVADYERARPGYPAALDDLLRRECGLAPGSDVADLGSGTGIFAALLLELGVTVHAVEPNDAMRRAAERSLAGRRGFVSVAGRAEDTGLPAHTIDVATAAQALHWFDPEKTHRELVRILRPAGRLVVVWNTRREGPSGFLRDYEDLLQRWGTDYREVDHRRSRSREQLARFFGHSGFAEASYRHEQLLDRAGLEARLLSSSYTPPLGHADREPMVLRLAEIFAAHERDGRVRMEYDTEVFYGVVSAASTHAR